jgi:integrase
MRLIFATDDLAYAGKSYSGFPLVLGNDMQPVEPAQTFLWWRLVEHPHKIRSKLSWKQWGHTLYDFFGYCITNTLDWRSEGTRGVPNALTQYRDWAKGYVGLDDSTINNRLGRLDGFYRWALNKGLLQKLPYDIIEIRSGRAPGFFTHVQEHPDQVKSNTSKLPAKAERTAFLTKEQIGVCIDAISNRTHGLMFRMLVRSGLRQCECRTFPEKYVFDPTRRKDLVPGQKIRISLTPADMHLKFGKGRDIDVPYKLMQDLWEYCVRRRQRRERAQREGKKFPNLFLTEAGNPYTESDVVKFFEALSSKVGFKVHAHMLRHSYATYLLYSLRKDKDSRIGDPLQYVADRLGHSNVSSAKRYLHVIENLNAPLVLMHEDEIDQLFALKEADNGGTPEEV